LPRRHLAKLQKRVRQRLADTCGVFLSISPSPRLHSRAIGAALHLQPEPNSPVELAVDAPPALRVAAFTALARAI
jgi:hypothetical protein